MYAFSLARLHYGVGDHFGKTSCSDYPDSHAKVFSFIFLPNFYFHANRGARVQTSAGRTGGLTLSAPAVAKDAHCPPFLLARMSSVSRFMFFSFRPIFLYPFTPNWFDGGKIGRRVALVQQSQEPRPCNTSLVVAQRNTTTGGKIDIR